MLTNRELAEKLGFPIGKVRRNTKELLGEDPKATRRSGYGRKFTLNEGFFVYIGSILVSQYGLTFGQTRDAIDIIKPWLLSNQLVPDPPKNSGSKGVDERIEKFFVEFTTIKGKISRIFNVIGTAREHGSDKIVKEDSGRTYSTHTKLHFQYYAKNNNGKIEYIHPYHWKDEEENTGDWSDYNFLPEFEINEILADYIYLVCGAEKFENHPIHLKFA